MDPLLLQYWQIHCTVSLLPFFGGAARSKETHKRPITGKLKPWISSLIPMGSSHFW